MYEKRLLAISFFIYFKNLTFYIKYSKIKVFEIEKNQTKKVKEGKFYFVTK